MEFDDTNVVGKPAEFASMIACLLWEGVGFESGPHSVILETLKWHLLILCLAGDFNRDSMGNVLTCKYAQFITMHS